MLEALWVKRQNPGYYVAIYMREKTNFHYVLDNSLDIIILEYNCFWVIHVY